MRTTADVHAGTPHAVVRARRIYDEAALEDGMRVLVDHVWPRGMSTQRAQLDAWCKELAPSSDLRTWYQHDPKRFVEFTDRYRQELDAPERQAARQRLLTKAADGPVTVLTATRALELSHAAVLASVLSLPEPSLPEPSLPEPSLQEPSLPEQTA